MAQEMSLTPGGEVEIWEKWTPIPIYEPEKCISFNSSIPFNTPSSGICGPTSPLLLY